jgi:hypothetical protein
MSQNISTSILYQFPSSWMLLLLNCFVVLKTCLADARLERALGSLTTDGVTSARVMSRMAEAARSFLFVG